MSVTKMSDSIKSLTTRNYIIQENEIVRRKSDGVLLFRLDEFEDMKKELEALKEKHAIPECK
jgi:hypothetical protein